MNRKLFLISIILLTAVLFQANAITFKLASLLPEGTEWNKALQQMGADWQQITDGRVRIKIYPGGIAGGESDVIRKMRIGQIDMAVLSTTGMTGILPDTFAMNIPFMLKTEEELDFIVQEVTPIFNDAILEKGFVVLTWSKSGWVNFFSKDPIVEPEDMMPMKFSGSVTQPELAEAFRNMGFNVISLDTPDVLMGLQSGMIESLYASPMLAASYQWFALADNMLDMKISPILGGIVITEKAWNKVPDMYKKDLIAAAMKMSESFYTESVSLEKKALNVMLDNGLRINKPNPDTADHWRALLGENMSVLVGDNGFVSTESYNKVTAMLRDFRSR